ncbi:hypothetical protein CK203_084957 [Vitis vinifera]|uniref:Retrotransposon gag domain-containing protein n=1 Tax=Vitis vinifera TaxID=29760 RepID=A0A438CXH6_VITVI|nr:hypothetical protein CK203_084957 [Vitis vinifera]
MRARLGPQEPGKTRPPVATTWGAHPDPLVTPMVQNVFPHQAIFKRSICPGTSFFESLAKKPPTTMDYLFQGASKYSMLEDDVRAATQQILVAGQASRNNAERSVKLPTGQGHPTCPTSGGRTPQNGPIQKDHSKKCAYHKEHGHTTETCRNLHYLVEKLIRVGHLKQYLRSDAIVRDTSRNHNSGPSGSPSPPKPL